MEAHSIFVAYSRLLNLHVNLADVIPISLAISADFTSTDDSEYRSNTGNPVLPARLGSLGRKVLLLTSATEVFFSTRCAEGLAECHTGMTHPGNDGCCPVNVRQVSQWLILAQARKGLEQLALSGS